MRTSVRPLAVPYGCTTATSSRSSPFQSTTDRRRLRWTGWSNASLQAVSTDNPGVWTGTEAAELLHADNAHRLQTALSTSAPARSPKQSITSIMSTSQAHLMAPLYVK